MANVNANTQVPGETPGTALGALLKEAVATGLVLVQPDGAAQVIGRRLQDVILQGSTNGIAVASARLREMLTRNAGPNGVFEGEMALGGVDSGGTRFHVIAKALPDGSVAASVCQGNSPDFDDRLQRLDKLAALGTLSAGMAHEIRNAMVAIRTFIELLLERDPGVELAATVQREIARIDSIVSGALSYVAQSKSQRTTLRMHELIRQALALTRSQFVAKSITATTSLSASPDTVLGEEGELLQVLCNLLLNAAEATVRSGRVSVLTESAVESNVGIKIVVSDSGPGIPADSKDRLFEPFFTTTPGGTGLGLSITQRIIHEHNGFIRAGTAEGGGASFEIWLPTVDAGPDPHPAAPM